MLIVRSFTICSISPKNQNTFLKLNISFRFLSHHTDKMCCVVPCIFNPLCVEFVSWTNQRNYHVYIYRLYDEKDSLSAKLLRRQLQFIYFNFCETNLEDISLMNIVHKIKKSRIRGTLFFGIFWLLRVSVTVHIYTNDLFKKPKENRKTKIDSFSIAVMFYGSITLIFCAFQLNF